MVARGFGGKNAKVFLEGRVGGRFYERRADGTEYQIGEVTSYQPPSLVTFTWRAPSWDVTTQVELRFSAEAGGTRVELEHSGWEQSAKTRDARKSYEGGIPYSDISTVSPRPHELKEESMKLFVLPLSPRAFKVIALKNHLGLDREMQVVDLGMGDQLTPEYIALNPNKKMPVLEDDGFVLWESNAIIFYLASKWPQSGLWPADGQRQADVLRWLAWESASLGLRVSRYGRLREDLQSGLAPGPA
jgi:hypothetical protein